VKRRFGLVWSAAPALALGMMVAAPPVVAQPSEARVAVIIGNNVGLAGEDALSYAEEDAERFREVLLDLGGVDSSRIELVRGGTAEQVRRAIERAVGRISELARSGPATLLVYASAHGDADSLHLEGTRLPIAELREAVAAAPATLRVTIIDACRTARVTTSKGGAPGPGVGIAVDASAAVRGDVLIRSAGAGEAAQEWSFLRGSLFTHHFLAGLRGAADLDHDGRVTLAEAYGHAFRHTTVGAVETTGGPQHPSFDMTMAGFGEWPMTIPERLGGRIELDRELAGHFWIADRSFRLIAELDKAPGEELSLAVRPGWYRVVQPDGAVANVADINVGWTGRRHVARADLARTTLRRATLRGGEPIMLRRNRLGLGYDASTGSVPGVAFEQGLALTGERVFDGWLARLRVRGTQGHLDVGDFVGRTRTARLDGGVGQTFSLSVLEVALGLQGSVAYVAENVERATPADIFHVIGAGEPARSAVLLGASAFGEAWLPLGDRFWLGVDAVAGLLRVPLWSGQAAAVFEAGGRVAIGWSF